MTLLLDSSNKNLSVALAERETIIARKEYDAWQQQSELMIPEIEQLLSQQQRDVKQIKRIVVAIGPGSYTGVRIAVTIAKVLAFALEAQLYTVSSLAVLAVFDKPTICLINARSNRSYFAVYHNNNALIEDSILSNDDVQDYIKTHPHYALSGDLTYLDIVPHTFDRFENMLKLTTKDNRVNDLLGVKPVYLKD